MILIKLLVGQDTPLRQFPHMTFCFSTEPLTCAKCLLPITHDSTFLMCSDLRSAKIWHEEHYTDDHFKENWKNKTVFGGIQEQHGDHLLILKVVSLETFNQIEAEEIPIE